MGNNFIDLLQNDEKQANKFRRIIWLILSIIIISNCIENLYYPMMGFFPAWDIWNRSPQ